MKLAFDEYLPAGGLVEGLSPVIFLHGRLYSKKTWMAFAPVIAEKTKRKVYALDARNHGESPWSNEMDFQIITNDLDEFLTDHKISKAIIIGHSLGGRTAITLAIQKPEKVEKLIVEDIGVEDYSTKAKNTVQQILNMLRISLQAIPSGADEIAAKKAVHEFIKSKLPPNTTKKGSLYDEDTLPLKKEGDKYVWQANLDVLEDMLMNKTSNQCLSGVYNGDALFLYGNKSFFDVPAKNIILPTASETACYSGSMRLKSVSATTRIGSVDIKTIYHFGSGSEYIEIFIDGELRAKIVKDELHDVYCNAMKHDDLPQGSDICASTVIEANGCVMKTDVARKGNRETIAVYKNGTLLCRTGNTVLQ